MFEPTFLSNTWVILGFFGLCLAVFHLLFVWVTPLSDIGWKKVDYVWLAVAGLTLLSAVSTVRHWESRAAFDFSKSSWTVMNQGVLDRVHAEKDYVCDTHFVRGEYAPSDFDEVGKEFSRVCAWYQKMSMRVEAELRKADPNLNLSIIADAPKIRSQVLQQGFEILRRFLEEQTKSNLKRAEWKLMSQDDDWDITRTRLTPLLFALALALRITKVSGEIRLARNRASRT